MKTFLRGTAAFLAILLATLTLGSGIGLGEQETVELPYFLNQFEDTSLDLRQYWGKAYLLFFFTEASESCQKQFPELKRIHETYNSQELQIVLIHEWAGENEENTQNVIRQFGLEGMTVFEDRDMSVARKINIPGCPMTIFMDAGGYLYDAFVYAVSYDMMAEILDVMEVSRSAPASQEIVLPLSGEEAAPQMP